MRLNLLPKSAARNVQSRTAFVAMLGLVVLTLAGTLLYSMSVSRTLANYTDEVNSKQVLADQVVATAASADTILAGARIVLTNSELVEQIDNSNGKYPRLYNTLKGYIPAFMRVRSLSAAASGPDQSVVTIQGYLKTFQQYSDVMISLLRFPGCSAVGRSGFGPVTAGDAGPFGYDPENPDRGPIPGWSAVTLTMSITSGDFANLQAPDPRATLQAAGTGSAPAGPTGGGGGGGGGNVAPVPKGGGRPIAPSPTPSPSPTPAPPPSGNMGGMKGGGR
jgi:hypothetical protein